MYINPQTLSNQSNPGNGLLKLTEEQEDLYIQYSGFVKIISADPLEIEPDTEAWEAWKAEQPDPLEEVKAIKITELSTACEQTIYAGMDIQLDGTTEHFNYDEKDQLNIKEMFDAVRMGATSYPYQSEDGECRIYTAAEIYTIYQSLAGLKTGNITYYHQLKSYVETLETAEEVQAVYYGQELTGDYLTHYNEMIAAAQEQMSLILGL